jgi:hypothetical protein
MTEAKHTPGPWKFTGFSKPSNFADHVAVVQGDGTVLARIKGGVTEDKATAEANARLIAAAPELLDLVQRVLLTEEPRLKSGQSNYAPSFHDELRAAIAKATGGAA